MNPSTSFINPNIPLDDEYSLDLVVRGNSL